MNRTSRCAPSAAAPPVLCRMDGNTSVAQRSRLMDDFNANPDCFLFLLTTKVGGIGVNLTGADRVLIYDPGGWAEAAWGGGGRSSIWQQTIGRGADSVCRCLMPRICCHSN